MLMKRKPIISISALAIGVTMLASCASANYKVSFSNYWFEDSDIPTETTEVLTYDVLFDEGQGLSGKNYTLDYSNGVYTTTFKTIEENGKKFYRLESLLTIDVTYTYNGVTSEVLSDRVATRVDFEKDVALTPIQSHKEVLSHSPSQNASSLESCYTAIHYAVDVTYNGASGTASIDNLSDSKPVSNHSFEIEDTDEYNYLDNEQLLFALRGINPAQASTPSFLVYAPFTKAVQTMQASFGSKISGEKFTFKQNGEDTASEKTLDYYSVTLALQEKNPGFSQTVKIATHTNPKANQTRNVILEMKTPLSYNLGTLTYTLNNAQFF